MRKGLGSVRGRVPYSTHTYYIGMDVCVLLLYKAYNIGVCSYAHSIGLQGVCTWGVGVCVYSTNLCIEAPRNRPIRL